MQKRWIILILFFIFLFYLAFIDSFIGHPVANGFITLIGQPAASALTGAYVGVTTSSFWLSYVAPHAMLLTFSLTSIFWILIFWRRTSIKNRVQKTFGITPKIQPTYQNQPQTQAPQVIPQQPTPAQTPVPIVPPSNQEPVKKEVTA